MRYLICKTAATRIIRDAGRILAAPRLGAPPPHVRPFIMLASLLLSSACMAVDVPAAIKTMPSAEYQTYLVAVLEELTANNDQTREALDAAIAARGGITTYPATLEVLQNLLKASKLKTPADAAEKQKQEAHEGLLTWAIDWVTAKTNKTEIYEEKVKRDVGDFIDNNHFGTGLLAIVDLGGKERVKDAQVVNGVVRVSDDDSIRVGIALEAHKFLGRLFGIDERVIWGVCTSVVSSEQQVIDQFGVGLALAFRTKVEAKASSQNSLNMSLLFMVDPDAKVLGDGLKDGEPLPAGETSIRYKEVPLYGLGLMISFGF